MRMVFFHPTCSQPELFQIPILSSVDIPVSDNSPISTVDVVPTIYDIVGIDNYDDLDEDSLFNIQPHRAVFAESGHNHEGEMIKITDGFKSFSIEGENLPDDVARHIENLKLKCQGETRAEVDSKLEEHLAALGYK